KKLVTSNPDSGKVRVRAFEDRDKEVSGILSMIRTAENPDECSVIARTNGLLDEVETRLSQQGIPYSRSGGRSFWDQKAPGMLMSRASSMARRDMLGVGELLQHAKVRRSTLDEMGEKL